MAGLVSGPERRNTTRVDGHDRSARSRALPARPLGGARRGSSVDSSEQQTTHVQSVGRLVLGATFEAAVSERRQSSAKPECPEVPSAGLRRVAALGSHGRGDRGLFGEAAPGWAPSSNQVRYSITGYDQAGNGSSGIPNPVTHAERGSETEAPGGQSLPSGRVPRLGIQIHSQASLHDSHRTGQDRVRCTRATCATSW